MKNRESFSSRLGFILISAGCAIGLGNVWRFPYITGQNGGAYFVLIYLFFLVIMGLPIMSMEFAVGRAGKKSAVEAFKALEPKGSKWHIVGYTSLIGSYLLMMFYTTIAGWMLAYCVKMITGEFTGVSAEGIGQIFTALTADPMQMTFWMAVVVILCFGVCSLGLKNGVERITKYMMLCLLAIIAVLAVRAITLPNALEGIKFYLWPDWDNFINAGVSNVIYDAMGQAFFTLSIGIGSMAIFGSYQSDDNTLLGEAATITLLDTSVAIISGLIIFPACFAYGITPDQGPSLIFVTLPNVFNAMPMGNIWGALFFVFMSFAALSTVIAIFQNIVAFFEDTFKMGKTKTIILNIVLVIVLSLPCIFGFNIWSSFQPLGANSNILDLEDFIISNNLLPLGSLVYCLFCTSKMGWGYDNYLMECNKGKGPKFPKAMRVFVSYIIPIVILFIFFQGYYSKFFM